MMKVRHYVEFAESLGQKEFDKEFEGDLCTKYDDLESELLTENGRVLTIRWNEDGSYRYHSKYKNK
jgi:hypothetical protein